MNISAKTKISVILKANEKAVDVIASINKHFLKLKNPILREALAPRVTVEQAAEIGKVDPEVILNKLREIGFEISASSGEETKQHSIDDIPGNSRSGEHLLIFDVRPVIDAGKDPLPEISNILKTLGEKTLLIINSFKPVPLIEFLRRKGFDPLVEKKQSNLFFTYFRRSVKAGHTSEHQQRCIHSWEQALSEYENKIVVVDVSGLEMPWPMINILSVLSEMDAGYALLVHHKKIPALLLPKLKARGYQYLLRENGTDIQLLLFKEK